MRKLYLRYGEAAINEDGAFTFSKQGLVESIAHHLWRMPRWGGATTFPWNVLQHTVFGIRIIENSYSDPIKRQALQVHFALHDAHEMITGDIPTPIKLLAPEIVAIQRRIDIGIYRALEIAMPTPEQCKEIENIDATLKDVEEAAMIYQSKPHKGTWHLEQQAKAIFMKTLTANIGD